MEEEDGWRWLWLGKMKKESIMRVCVCFLGGGGVCFFLFPIFLEEAAEDGLKASPGVNRI